MHRTQICLPDAMVRELDRAAAARGLSRAEWLREAAQQRLDRDGSSVDTAANDDSLDAIVAMYDSGPSNTAIEHDRVLVDAERRRWN
jgi:metal-responsive CopG/Arc/MetJ family transcriptional regulator